MDSQAYEFSKILFFLPFLSITFRKYPNLKYQSQEYLEHCIMSESKRTYIRLGEGIQVAERRRWQSAMTSPIGDVGSERVNVINILVLVAIFSIMC